MEKYNPVYEHDCSECQFLQNVGDDNGKIYDVYYHEQPSGMNAIIIRSGNDGPEYWSCPIVIVDSDPNRFSDAPMNGTPQNPGFMLLIAEWIIRKYNLTGK